MTNEEIKKHKDDLGQIVQSFNDKREKEISDSELHGKLLDIFTKLRSLAEKVGASKCIGAGYVLIAPLLASGICKKQNQATEAEITELIFGINNALQTEMMLNACVSAEKSSTTAKWACFWAAIAAIAACISVLLVLFCG